MVLTFEVRRSVDPRWRDLLARAVLGEVGDLLGEPTVHHELATALERIEAKILELYGELCRRGELPAAGAGRRAHRSLPRVGALG